MQTRSGSSSQPLMRSARARYLLVFGLVLMLIALAGGARAAWSSLAALPHVAAALGGGSIAALATALGAMPVLLTRHLPDLVRDALIGFGAGVMLAASVFSLIIPGLEAARGAGAGPFEAGFIVSGGILLGAAALILGSRLLPEPDTGDEAQQLRSRTRQRTWLFVIAIVLHNLPEGLAIGVAHAGGDAQRAAALTSGIAIQDVPEGFVVAMALAAVGYRRLTAVGLGVASGLVEPVGAVFGAAVIALSAALLPWGLAFAAGAMLSVVCHEVIPEAQRGGHRHAASSGLLVGFVVMMLLDTALA